MPVAGSSGATTSWAVNCTRTTSGPRVPTGAGTSLGLRTMEATVGSLAGAAAGAAAGVGDICICWAARPATRSRATRGNNSQLTRNRPWQGMGEELRYVGNIMALLSDICSAKSHYEAVTGITH